MGAERGQAEGSRGPAGSRIGGVIDRIGEAGEGSDADACGANGPRTGDDFERVLLGQVHGTAGLCSGNQRTERDLEQRIVESQKPRRPEFDGSRHSPEQ